MMKLVIPIEAYMESKMVSYEQRQSSRGRCVLLLRWVSEVFARTLEGDNQTKSETSNPDDNNGDGSDEDVHVDDHDNDENNGGDENGPTTDRPLPTTEPQLPTTTTTDVSFIGDDETVEDHIKHGAGSTASPIPDICEGNYDSVANLREELFFFKGKYLWRLSQRGKIQPGYPVLFRNMFWKLPETVTKIDAAYQRQTDNNIIFFTGNQYWVYDGDDFVQGSPRSITDYGFPHDLNKIDAVMIWKKNGKTFFYA
ncbi:unnamed protein product [Timema podura]|uniref:Uncharacterized protein n=1 Tax=Timema podura TaxID=61482 RepID=A0ABN7NXF5_TIMPD|nr:unnamed protein product [Timema podura]